jgi:F-type H+-transporting ATPase subunit delta
MEFRPETRTAPCCYAPDPMLDAARRSEPAPAEAGAAGFPSRPRPARGQKHRERQVASGATTIASGGGLTDRYAAALYAHAEDQHALDAVVAEMEGLGQLIDTSADFRRLLESPLIDVNQATRAATAVLEQQGFGKQVRDFVGVITANRRLRNLRAIVTAFAALVAERRGIITAHVASAHPLNDVQRQQLRARLIEAGYGNVNILESVEPDLLGGLVVRIGARLYDTSLKSRLQRLQYAMKGAA